MSKLTKGTVSMCTQKNFDVSIILIVECGCGSNGPKLFCFRDPEFVFYDQLKQTMNAYRFVLIHNTIKSRKQKASVHSDICSVPEDPDGTDGSDQAHLYIVELALEFRFLLKMFFVDLK